MNSSEIKNKIQNQINTICETNRNRYRRQYPAAKWALEKLEALGLNEYIENIPHPRDFGQNDAQNILAAVGTQVEGSGDDYQAHTGIIGQLLAELKTATRQEEEDAAATQATAEGRSTFDARYTVTKNRYERECELIRQRFENAEIDEDHYHELMDRAFDAWERDKARALRNDPLRKMRMSYNG